MWRRNSETPSERSLNCGHRQRVEQYEKKVGGVHSPRYKKSGILEPNAQKQMQLCGIADPYLGLPPVKCAKAS